MNNQLPMAINPSIESKQHVLENLLNCFTFVDTEKQLVIAYPVFLHLGYTKESAQAILSKPMIFQYTNCKGFVPKEALFISIPQIGELIVNAPKTKYISHIIEFVKNILIPLFNQPQQLIKHDDFKKETIMSKVTPTENHSQKFHSDLFGDLTVLTHADGNLWFIGKEVAEKLGYEDPSKMYARIDEEDKQTVNVKDFAPAILADANSKARTMILINESGLYVAVLGSKKPEAKEFKRWVTKDILPSIRKTGGYGQSSATLPNFADPAEAAIAWANQYKEKSALQLELKAKDEILEQAKPMIGFAETVQKAEKGILVRDLAYLAQNEANIKIGEKRLWTWMRTMGYIHQKSTRPMQEFVERGFFVMQPTIVHHHSGAQEHMTTKITGNGQIYFLSKLKEFFTNQVA